MAAEGSPSYGPRERGLDLLLEEDLYDDIDSLDDESLCLLPPAVPSLHLVPEKHPEKHGGDDAEHGLWTLGGPSRESQKLHRLELCPPDQTAAFEAVDEQGNVVIDLPQVRAAGTVGPNGGKSVDGMRRRRLIRVSTVCVGGCRSRTCSSFGSGSSRSVH